ncbi:unnamed protein product [Rotaria sp. Silwood2]|nr:unnamed protein product [Rotaria sp. Silwood2]
MGMQSITISQLNMYHTENYLDRYCLLLFEDHLVTINAGTLGIIHIYEIASYCLRLTDEYNFTAISNFENVTNFGFSFIELKEKNITSNMLLSWSASIDLVEQYEMFLMNNSTSLSTNEIFYNCTSFWFGPFCRFKFDYSPSQSFYDIVKISFKAKRILPPNSEVTCYKHLPCKTFLSCLNWREICDGSINCLDGSDEENCWQLEVNQCIDEEYQCHNGQCIPKEFFRDVRHHPDCIDQTDESALVTLRYCYSNPSFECEEVMCRPGSLEFSCGDGECTSGIATCANGRSNIVRNDFCSNTTACLLESNPMSTFFCLRCKRTHCIKENCPSKFELRSIPPIFGHVNLMFLNTINSYYDLLSPDYVCYDEKLCEHFLPITHYIGNTTCRQINVSKLTNGKLFNGFAGVIQIVKNQFRSCLMINNKYDYCNSSTMYQCTNSRKCISKQRLLDDFRDCPENDDEEYNQSCSLHDAHQRFQCRYENQKKCLAFLVFGNIIKDCEDGEDEIFELEQYNAVYISFQKICDGMVDLLPLAIDGQYETDETNCKYWPCNNIYTRCNKVWNCKNGVDEMSCSHTISSLSRNQCVFLNDTLSLSCSSINRTNEQKNYFVHRSTDSFEYLHCWNDTKSIPFNIRCAPTLKCPVENANPFCSILSTVTNPLCSYLSDAGIKYKDRFICSASFSDNTQSRIYFKLHSMLNYHLQITDAHTSNQWLNK